MDKKSSSLPGTRRRGAGLNRNLDANFIWPNGFGSHNIAVNAVPSIITPVREGIPDEDTKDGAESMQNGGMPKLIIVEESIRRPQAVSRDLNFPSTSYRCSENLPIHSAIKSGGSQSSADVQKRVIEIEKVRQKIELKKLEHELKLLELENKVCQSEVSKSQQVSVKSCNHPHSIVQSVYSDHKTSDDLYTERVLDSDIRTAQWVDNIPHQVETVAINNETSQLSQLCNTVAEAIKSVANNSFQNKLTARHTVERDFPFFDGASEEWPMFISQFRRISSLCQYTHEEQKIKLQKCLRGEAKFAVLGMMVSPDNIDLVLRTLEMRFGRPDQIIETLITKVQSIPAMKDQHFENLIHFSNNVRYLVTTIKSLECVDHLKNPQVLKTSVQKLPDMLKLRWGEEVAKYNGKVDLEQFSNWIDDMATAACYVTPTTKSQKFDIKTRQYGNYQSKRPESSFMTAENSSHDYFCTYCQTRGHKVDVCEKIKADDVETRWNTVTKRKLCFSCLKSKHHTSKCRSKYPCGTDGCRRSHHRLLHKDIPGYNPNPETVQEIQPNENVLAVGNGDKNVLLRMVNVCLHGPDSVVETTALCDEASTVSLIDTSIVEKLGLEGKKQPLCIQWTNNMKTCHEESSCLDIGISGIFKGARIFDMKNVRSVENLSLPIQVIKKDDWTKYPHVKNLPFSEITKRPMILLGQDNIRLTVARQVIQGRHYQPIALKTNLGWILHGNSLDDKSGISSKYTFHVCNHEFSDEALHQMVKHSFTTDAFGVMTLPSKISKAEIRAQQIMENTSQRIGNRFEIGLLWKEDDIHLPESKTVAIQRLYCVERQMRLNDVFRQTYCDKIQDYIRKGYARKLSQEESRKEGPRCWYLPHFGVVNPKKPNKFRLVFDAASRSNGVSLNDHLLSGPDLLQSLVEVLMKFRQKKIAFCSDVKEMFHQVRIIPEDQSSQRFLWRDGETNRPYDTYEMQVITFGATCSPSCAQYIKNLNATQRTTRPEVLDAIIKKHYVDDYLDSTDTVEEALELISEVRRVQKLGGFDLVNWTSNSEEVLDILSVDGNSNKDLNLDDSKIQRVLGLSWNSKTDEICFQLKRNNMTFEESIRPTKRQILKIVMSLFDPLGLIVNLTIRARILIQEIWKSGIGWDDEIDDELHQTWKMWLTDLQEVTKISVSRVYSLNISNAQKIEIHLFCDASKKAFASVAYLRVVTEETIDVSFIIAKARVAPTKPISIPRLELQAALMGSRLAKTVASTIGIRVDKVYFWSDSTTVLFWIKGDGTKLGQFEAHRVGEIQENTDSNDWHWIPSNQNAADSATRTYSCGANTIDFDKWYTGPNFLYMRDETSWPTQKISMKKLEETDTEPEIIVLLTELDTTWLPDVRRFSKWTRLMRSTAYVKKIAKNWISKIPDKHCQLSWTLSVDEIQSAEAIWIRRCQQESFSEDIQALKKNRTLKGRLRLLCPSFDKNGLLVLQGRTDLATELEQNTKKPIILPSKHRLTKILLMYYHEKFAHQGIETILNEVRRKYWVIDGRAAVKSVFARCHKCQLLRAKPQIPRMGQLPTFRLTSTSRAFTYTGIDYFGPLYVKIGRRREKRWGVIFTCLTVRAIHLEVAHSLTSDCTIMAVRRMISRRGQPEEIHSDNGTNFHGASEELKIAVANLDRMKLTDEMTTKGITWKFIPPASPHMGGVWERLVRTVKNTFHCILNEQVLTDELLLTLFAECENIINSRPITKVSVDPNDMDALTPNHFLLGSTNELTPLEELQAVDLRRQWMKSQILKDHFWKRWTREYLPTLTKRTKWSNDGKPIQQHDMVIVVEENAPRRSWKLERVEKIFPGTDGRVRVVEVRTKNGVYKRPVSKLCRLEIHGE